MARRKIKVAPNLRPSQSCGTCAHWQWGYEGEGTCEKYHDSFDLNQFLASTDICDDWCRPTPQEKIGT